jgi:hypothetical protein
MELVALLMTASGRYNLSWSKLLEFAKIPSTVNSPSKQHVYGPLASGIAPLNMAS